MKGSIAIAHLLKEYGVRHLFCFPANPLIDASASVGLLAHLSLGTTTIAWFGNDEQKKRFVPSLATGKGVAAWALTEPGGGSDAAAMRTTVTERDGTYFLNGSKTFITNARVAESIVVFATQDASKGHRGISAFVVEKDSPGLQINPLTVSIRIPFGVPWQ